MEFPVAEIAGRERRGPAGVVTAGSAHEADLAVALGGEHPPAVAPLLVDPAVGVDGAGDQGRLHQVDRERVARRHRASISGYEAPLTSPTFSLLRRSLSPSLSSIDGRRR
jgi:hypothetical protein